MKQIKTYCIKCEKATPHLAQEKEYGSEVICRICKRRSSCTATPDELENFKELS